MCLAPYNLARQLRSAVACSDGSARHSPRVCPVPTRSAPLPLRERPHPRLQTFLDRKEVTDRVTQVLKNFEKVDASKVVPGAAFSADLGLDSLDAVEVRGWREIIAGEEKAGGWEAGVPRAWRAATAACGLSCRGALREALRLAATHCASTPALSPTHPPTTPAGVHGPGGGVLHHHPGCW